MIFLCLFGVISIQATEYETYDCEYFSVEYPADWIVMKKVDTSLQGWKYNFVRLNPNANVASVIVSETFNSFTYMNSFDNVLNGSMLDGQIRHFIDSLEFKQGSNGSVSIPTRNGTYDCMYFTVEYPAQYRGISGKMQPEVEYESILDLVSYTFNLYKPDNDLITLGQISITDDGNIGVSVATERAGKLANGIVTRFFDTLQVKA